MTVNEMLISRKMSKYRLSKLSGIPYATLSDICSGKTELPKCSAETVYRLSSAFGVPMEELLHPYFENRLSFELFKSEVCHRVKELGDLDFLMEALKEDTVNYYYKKKWYPECFYMLAMIDYLSRINGIPLCSGYDSLRGQKLASTLFPSGVLALASSSKNSGAKEEAVKNSIPEFIRFNIVESEIRNVN